MNNKIEIKDIEKPTNATLLKIVSGLFLIRLPVDNIEHIIDDIIPK